MLHKIQCVFHGYFLEPHFTILFGLLKLVWHIQHTDATVNCLLIITM